MRARCVLLACVCAVAGCGFRRVAPTAADGGAVDAATATPDGGSDVDLAGGGGASGGDAMPAADAGPGGPLGALPQGFCCQTSDQCRARDCGVAMLGHTICIESCVSDADCTAYSSDFHCDPTYHLCAQNSSAGVNCIDASSYTVGTRPTGACCDGAAAHAGAECAGGWCLQTGAASNPYYCSQGCTADEPCPTGYSCDTTRSRCVHVDAVYACQ